MFYILHGEDELGREEALGGLRQRMAGGDAAMADLNTSVLDGDHLTMGELRHVCDAIPFLSDRRLIIVHGLLTRLFPKRGKRGQAKASSKQTTARRAFLDDLAAYLTVLPPTTRLVFVEPETLPRSHPILKLARAEEMKGQGYVKLFELPREGALPGWIQQRARAKGGEFQPQAAGHLAALVGRNLRLLDLEIEKLLLYSDGRAVSLADVQLLVSRAREANIFHLVDSVGQRRSDRALRLLHALLEDDQDPLYVLAMLARQIRLLIQVSELGGQGLDQTEIARRLKLQPFVARKMLAQARNFRLHQLEAAHACLVRTDWLIKTGQMDGVLALDTLVVDLASV